MKRIRDGIRYAAPVSVAMISVLNLFLVPAVSVAFHWHALFQTLLLSVAISAAITGICLLLLRRDHGMAVFVATFACMAIFLQFEVFLGLNAMILVLALARPLLRRVSHQVSLTELTGWAFLFALLAFCGQVVLEIRASSRVSTLYLPVVVTEALTPRESAPDIYYIIVDGHGSAGVLEGLYNADISGFIDALERRGFKIASQSRSNYVRTIESLSSSLNMNYLDSWSTLMGDSSAWWPMATSIQENQIMMALRKAGYQIVSSSQVWDFSDLRRAEHLIRPYVMPMSEFDQAWLATTALRPVVSLTSDYVPGFNPATKRRIALHTLDALPDIARRSGPKFVFAHILLPHPAFVFSADGGNVDPPYPYSGQDGNSFTGTREEYIAGYRDQVAFLDTKLIEVIDGILANSQSPPVIIIQGDHGPGSQLNFGSLEKTCLWERFSILNAYYLPGIPPEAILADMTPVNTFRLILNTYFSTELPYLPNREYFSSSSTPYQFIDVTETIGTTCEDQ